MNEKWHNGILIQSFIVTIQYHHSYVWQDPFDAVQYIFNEQYDTGGVLFITKRVYVVNIRYLLPRLIKIRINVDANRI